VKPTTNQEAPKYLSLLLSILFIGTSGPLARLIHLSPFAIICFRSFGGLLFLLLFIRLSRKSIWIKNKRNRNFIWLSGLFLAAHWVCYFFALQLSTVALGMLSMFTFPVITVLLEPFFAKTRLRLVQILVAMLALLGIYIMLPTFDVQNDNTLGIAIGLLSALLYALRNLILKKHSFGEIGLVVVSHQLLIVGMVTLPFALIAPPSFLQIKESAYYLLFLALVTTAIGHTFFLKSLQHFSASTVSILSNFTPLVGIVLGMLFLQENPAGNVILGGLLILCSAFLEVWLSRRKK